MKYLCFFIGIVLMALVVGNANAEIFRVVVLPDTQIYAKSYPDIYTNQTQWIVNNKDSLNIDYVIHLGDIVDGNGNTTQWDRANTSMSLLDGVLNYTVIPGNHDMSSFVMPNFHLYFDISRFNVYQYFQSSYPANTMDNNYAFFSADGEDFIVLGIQWCPNNTILSWANDTLTTYESKNKIVFTHSYMNNDGTRVHEGDQWACSSNNRGDEIFDKVIKHHTKVRLVLSGHILGDGLGRRMDVINGYPCNQILQNYQTYTNGGNGWLRYFEFDIPNNKIHAKTYSPYLGLYNTSKKNQFSMYWNIPNN